MVKHNPNYIGVIGGNTPGSTVFQPQQQQQPIASNSNTISQKMFKWKVEE
jgi:hypothetical protein